MDPAAADFPYHLAASDLDGTLLGPRKEIGPENTAAVRRLQGAGARFILASGRRHQNSIRFYRELALDGWLISCAGALIKDPANGQTLREVPLPAPVAARLVADGQAEGYTIIYYHRDHLYISGRNHWTDLYESRVNEKAELFPGNLNDLQGDAALKIVWYGEPDKVKAARPALEKAYREQVTVVATDPENLEFLAVEANKAAALAAVASYYRVPPAGTVAFGDGENDAPMLGWAGLGVAVDGSNDRAKEAADFTGPAGPPETRFARAVAAVFEHVAAR